MKVLAQRPDANSEDDATTADLIERAVALGDFKGVVVAEHEHMGGKLQGGRMRRQVSECRQRIPVTSSSYRCDVVGDRNVFAAGDVVNAEAVGQCGDLADFLNTRGSFPLCMRTGKHREDWCDESEVLHGHESTVEQKSGRASGMVGASPRPRPSEHINTRVSNEINAADAVFTETCTGVVHNRNRSTEARYGETLMAEFLDLETAIARYVQRGDSVHVVVGHTRWTAGARELVRQWWERDPQFELVMLSLSSLGALFFRGGLVRKVITGYSGDTFPNFTPNPWFQRGYASGAVDVEHWSFLAFSQRLEAGAKGMPAIATRSISDSSMDSNDAFAVVDTPFGRVGMLAPLVPDVALLHAPVADRHGNVALHPPMLEGVWGALAARRGAVVTVERVVDDLRPWSHLVKIPAHCVAAVVEAPMGAHPGGLYVGDLPVDGYGEDYDFWVEARAATRGDDFDAWVRHWVLDVRTQREWLDRLGEVRTARLRSRAAADSWQLDRDEFAVDIETPPNAWECAAVMAAEHLAQRAVALGAHAVLAGAGVANLAAWLGVRSAREMGAKTVLTAEIGLWDYEPVPGDPFVLNHRNFPGTTMLSDATMVLGGLVGGRTTTTIGCLGGAQIDRFGNINSTSLLESGGPFLVGSGGGNDVASTAAECVVVALLSVQRTPSDCAYITSPGHNVRALVTDLATFEKVDDSHELVLTAVPSGDGSLQDRIDIAVSATGWPVRVAAVVRELAPIDVASVHALREWDPRSWFLRG